MKLCDCKFFADKNVDPAIVAWLRSEGYDAMSVVAIGLQGYSDVDVLRVATAEERVVFLS
jgi:predicted nuclease of predicted toxin-antitoxin system